MTAAPAALMAETPADTLVVAAAIDDIVSLDPAEAYELTGIEVLTNHGSQQQGGFRLAHLTFHLLCGIFLVRAVHRKRL